MAELVGGPMDGMREVVEGKLLDIGLYLEQATVPSTEQLETGDFSPFVTKREFMYKWNCEPPQVVEGRRTYLFVFMGIRIVK